MKIDINRVEGELIRVRTKLADLQAEEQGLIAEEKGLVAFLEMINRYRVRTDKQQKQSAKAKTKRRVGEKPAAVAHTESKPRGTANFKRANTGARFQPHRFPPQPIPEGYKSRNRRTELLREIVAHFVPDSIITVRDINDKIGSSWPVPDAVKPLHHFSAVLMHETGPGAVLEKSGPGQWRVKPNALELLQSRVAAEIAQAEDEASRQPAH